ncbi:putative membrane protein [Ulvibacter sp. MAR_2010_11]|uniref:DoxX family protein n=1 Tax=Ulvibacter sp. MAR_2010_11 TaxID=1250229 RepID=UPI000C2C8204|nr:MauE/DoxX family redox-associated membrane protein [Ulvibacter sp. MAR_2010_11]PKA83686.1 putative membrane protein [Ulvibacter sp. MAR_2010_11]
MLPWHQYLLGALLVVAGFNHFRVPKVYERIMPSYIPAHSTMVLLSGIAEMVLGLMLLNQKTQTFAAWGIITMLLVFLTVHFYMLQNEKASLKLPKWILVLRVPLQFVLIYWVYQYV